MPCSSVFKFALGDNYDSFSCCKDYEFNSAFAVDDAAAAVVILFYCSPSCCFINLALVFLSVLSLCFCCVSCAFSMFITGEDDDVERIN